LAVAAAAFAGGVRRVVVGAVSQAGQAGQAGAVDADRVDGVGCRRLASGRPELTPRSGGKLYLVPGDGTDSQWYKNLLKTPAVRLAARGAQYIAMATPITDPGMFTQILDYFRAKCGVQYVASLYPHPNVAVEIPLA
jgi:hypothetical protein